MGGSGILLVEGYGRVKGRSRSTLVQYGRISYASRRVVHHMSRVISEFVE